MKLFAPKKCESCEKLLDLLRDERELRKVAEQRLYDLFTKAQTPPSREPIPGIRSWSKTLAEVKRRDKSN